MTKPNKCPICESISIADILYGLPANSKDLSMALEKKRIVLGGCCVTDNDPEWHCNECGYEW